MINIIGSSYSESLCVELVYLLEKLETNNFFSDESADLLYFSVHSNNARVTVSYKIVIEFGHLDILFALAVLIFFSCAFPNGDYVLEWIQDYILPI